jgi:uncharacterized protein
MQGDLRSKLQMYKNNQDIKPQKEVKKGLDIHDLLSGTLCENESGKFFIIEKKYPLEHIYGGYKIGHLTEVDLTDMGTVLLSRTENRPHVRLSDMLFLDTETTGLSGGVGTVAFLIGTGFFEENYFVLRQYFMRDYDEELAMLQELNRQLAGYKVLVTFNGKAFDWNLISSRFAFNRIRSTMKEPLHMDLLYPSRKIWKLKLESCKLTRLEESILNEYRVDDVPGALIPSIYFKYLEDRDCTEIKKVITHNELDILTMLSLMGKIHSMLENPLTETDGDKELLGIGRVFEDTERYKAMVDCYKTCNKSENGFVKATSAKRLANAYKRNSDYINAVELWENMIEDGDAISLYPLVELAKFYEHKERDIGKALETVEKAINLTSNMSLYSRENYNEIKKRYDRLKRKASR